jgi:predicted DsbA family dithiol-disulfide isomerase
MAEAQKAGITGTPAILLGWLQPDGKTVKAVNLIKGAQPFTAFKAAVDSLLASKE